MNTHINEIYYDKDYFFTIVNGKKVKLMIETYDSTCRLFELTTWTDNRIMHGPYRSWWEYGELSNIGPYTVGPKWEESYFINGKLHGLYKTWYPNGNQYEECYYIAGKKEGIYSSWNEEDGTLNPSRFYTDDIEVDYKIYLKEHIEKYKEELMAKIFHPDRLERMAKLYGLDTIDYMDALE